VAEETREGEVFRTLFTKLEQEREALGGQVFDVLGKLTFDNRPLRDLLVEAIRYGDQPAVRARLHQIVDASLDREHLAVLLEERSLAQDSMDTGHVRAIRARMERADARRLQPHYIAGFFLEAFRRLGGTVREREPRRYEITHVPGLIRSRDRQIGGREAVLPAYERIAFEKELLSVPGTPLAAFVCPGHPLLDATIDLLLEQHRDLLTRGAVLVDPADTGHAVRVLCYIEHAIQDARNTASGARRVISRQVQFVEIDERGQARGAGYAPYLDYRPLADEERALIAPALNDNWLSRNLEDQARSYAIAALVPAHLAEVRGRREALIDKTTQAVRERLLKEINYWDLRANQLRDQEQAGKTPRLNSAKAQQRANDLEARLQTRLAELVQERQIAPLPPVVVGGALIVPQGLLDAVQGEQPVPEAHARETRRVELLAMEAVLVAERALGYDPRDVSAEKCGYDIESRVPETGAMRFIEVKGRVAGAETVTITRNEILTGLNKTDQFVLALVEVDGALARLPRYLRRPFTLEPDFGVTSVNYDLSELLAHAHPPA
jgi:hypothetical protein